MNGLLVIHEPSTGRWLRFDGPSEIIAAHEIDDVMPAVEAVEARVNSGHYAAGFIAYEAAPAFDPSLETHEESAVPLCWFGIYDEPTVIDAPFAARTGEEPPPAWEPNISRADYQRAIAAIKDYIGNGHTYQVNFTYRLRAPFDRDPWRYFQTLARGAHVPYAAFVETGDHAIVSASPELFFRLDGEDLVSMPMKGTAPRGVTAESDKAEGARLLHSDKNRAENVMIVDMVRNDMGRVARIGSVHVPSLYNVERYPTVWQMTSTVAAKTGAPVTDILRALFPCASITGAPKHRTMQIVRELETEPRGIYTGSIGFIAPDRRAQFNVAIRTVTIDKAARRAEYGVGGGIIWDSVDSSEFEECATKALIVSKPHPNFQLLETIAWTQEKEYHLLGRHLDRLMRSAGYFGIRVTEKAVTAHLSAAAEDFDSPHYIRLLVDHDGNIAHEAYALPDVSPRAVRVALADEPVSTDDVFLYHKTTHRAVYDAALASHPYADDVILWNERHEVTESCTSNVVVELNGELFTPPVRCGLLAGTYRQRMLDERLATERVIKLRDLEHADRILLANSVRGIREARVVRAVGSAA